MNQRARSIAVLFISGFLAAAAQAQTSVPFDGQNFESIWNRAHLQSDTASLDALWADDVSIVVPGMSPLGKADALKMWQSVPVKFTAYESTDVSARVEGTIAVVTGKINRARVFGNRSAKEQWYFTKVYRLANSAWRVIAFHASNAPE
ncbi:MAG: nuclear transport factor 2 family protein [Burkholderiales bacterium]|nr:nuclear transport factor 2 family protein [Burkholderiales bacterium]